MDTNPYKTRYHSELAELKTMSEELADLVGAAIKDSMTALSDSDQGLGKDVIKSDAASDELGLKMENKCMELLALQQPMAKDLRLIVGVLKIGIDLERIGDLAVDIARVAVSSGNQINISKVEYLPHMAETDRKMLSQSMVALANGDSDLARQTTKWDYEVDGLYVKARDYLLKVIIENPMLINEATSLLLVTRHLERIGDHICNICESIIYMVEAKRERLN